MGSHILDSRGTKKEARKRDEERRKRGFCCSAARKERTKERIAFSADTFQQSREAMCINIINKNNNVHRLLLLFVLLLLLFFLFAFCCCFKSVFLVFFFSSPEAAAINNNSLASFSTSFFPLSLVLLSPSHPFWDGDKKLFFVSNPTFSLDSSTIDLTASSTWEQKKRGRKSTALKRKEGRKQRKKERSLISSGESQEETCSTFYIPLSSSSFHQLSPSSLFHLIHLKFNF